MRIFDLFPGYYYFISEDAEAEAKHADIALQSAKRMKGQASISKAKDNLVNKQKQLTKIISGSSGGSTL